MAQWTLRSHHDEVVRHVLDRHAQVGGRQFLCPDLSQITTVRADNREPGHETHVEASCTDDSVGIDLPSRRRLQARLVESVDLTPDDLDFRRA